ncbi:hypothetical protein M406DRAFT_253352 [Cryphonectria parasitica EP155]|uniref:Cupin type-2 domain-containing protein n=1 Tax=Cryphonectria parasitica (strain ATCC 38755 / EP155) TaxID=660469 RepID=A0A9P4Y696_CRYP1|nr:uncharacterized protein M406DRAFT_253352 [Cryphonectria parasitica EP155]KAF3767333.1 hypothetical protein M406DRAFT_253352 [Cryphonectria parasitica EP155]
MLSFLAKHPPRTKISHLDKFSLDGGRSLVEFKRPASRYLVINRLPPAASDAEARREGLSHNGANSSLAPPLHKHFWQEETFHVMSGTARFTLGTNRAERLAAAGEVVVVPRREIHTFCNASEETGLVVEFVLDPVSRGTDEAYFRNVWGYRDDCRKAGIRRSFFQALLFMHHGGIVMALPGPEMVFRYLGLLLNYVGGVMIGQVLLGYHSSYPEYYHNAAL